MRAHELRIWQRALGLHEPELAYLLGVRESTVARWLRGAQEIPAGVQDDLLDIADDVAERAALAVATGQAVVVPDEPVSAAAAAAALNLVLRRETDPLEELSIVVDDGVS